ncbi:MAG TPA: TetR family transcriptional regulator [Steroidobacteraceae bacterium]|nr:TetR family transcriptional regulator [Steroidobacteraceae bacterium]
MAKAKPVAKNSNARRVRRTPEEARTLALASARRLLLAEGPDAITLQSVATDLGMSHTNLIHHFGSAAGLQSELMRQMMSELTAAIESAVMRLRAGKGEFRDFVDIVFDAFDRGGAGRLAAWIVLSGESTRLAPIGEVVRDYIDSVERSADPAVQDVHERVTSATLFVTMAALGDAIIGNPLRRMVGRERDAVRKIIGRLLPVVLEREASNG